MVVLVCVDNITYLFLGYADTVNTTVNLTDTVISPTQTTLMATAGPMQVNLTFLNPIEPGNWVKQSIPFSYLSLTTITLDGEAHAVQVHSNLSAEWMSANRNQNPAVFNEIATQPEWGTLHHAMKSGGEITYKIAEDSVVLQTFKFEGVLDNQTIFVPLMIDCQFLASRATLAPSERRRIPLSGVFQYPRSALNASHIISQIVDFLDDFADASSRAQQLDLRILQDAGTVSRKLGDVVSLATAQVYGSIQVTVGTDLSGNLFNESDVMAFMKNIALMYIDPKLGGLILEPLLQFQPMYEYRRNFECWFINNVKGIWEYVNHDFCPRSCKGGGGLKWGCALSTSMTLITLDDHRHRNVFGPPTNDHNLAINNIISIKAMYNMSWILNQTLDSDQSPHSFDYYNDLALANDQHILAAHEQADSWVLGYNLFADVWLGTSVVEPSVYQAQSAFVDNLISTSTFSKFGMPVDSLGSDLDVVVSTPILSREFTTERLITRAQACSRSPTTAPAEQPSWGQPYAWRNSSHPPERVAPVPVGLSSKELAQMRSRSRPTGGQILTPFNPTGPTLTGAAPLDTRPQTDQQQPVAPVPAGFPARSLRSCARVPDPLTGSHSAPPKVSPSTGMRSHHHPGPNLGDITSRRSTHRGVRCMRRYRMYRRVMPVKPGIGRGRRFPGPRQPESQRRDA
ncbi:hypothetical protein EDB92DRAFT_1820053 [Lactarius akahatsu]|uniref:Uncharacterized protein n=1 Tax=Lactarius akahatsu TaxID=416441 RepID=A0AAD4L6B4_9AGAM|nr:hypothetical protein EDB92DRAFT_1820053 [Lactarius akahatsu]